MEPSLVISILCAVMVVQWGLIGMLLLRLSRTRRDVDELATALAREPASLGLRVAGKAMKAVVETAHRVRDQGVTGMLMSSLEDFTRWAGEDRAEIAKVASPDGTVTIFFSDIEDSTAHNERLGDDSWLRVLDAHDRIVRQAIERHNGHVVKTQGDGFMVVFGEPTSAVAAALEIQARLDRGSRRLRENIRVRIGAHTGEVVSKDGDYFGLNVAFAARVAAQAQGGQILVSDDVMSEIAVWADEQRLLTEARMEVELKGLAGAHQLFEVRAA